MNIIKEKHKADISGLRLIRAAAAGALAVSLSLSSMPIFALASPRFARTEEEWTSLEDNVLNFEEIADLVEEYNATVRQNEEDYSKDERKTMDAQDVREMMIKQADEYDQMAVNMEGTSQSSAAQYRMQANSIRSQADDNVTDYTVLRLSYDRMRDEIVQSAKTYFFDYYQSLEEQKKALTAYESAKLAYDSAVNRFNVGLATQIDVMTADEALKSAQAATITADTAAANSKRLLQVTCGWNYASEPEIGPLPEMDLTKIASIDLSADTEQAINYSYTIRTDQRMLANTISSNNYVSLREKYQDQIEDDTDQVRNSVRTAYDTLVNSKTAYDNAVTARELSEGSAATAERNFSLGQLSNTEYQSALKSLETARYDEEIARIAVMSAWTSYESVINGLASAGTTAG